MEMMLLDYSNFIESKHAQSVDGTETKVNMDLFFQQRGWCPFCKKDASKVYTSEGPYNRIEGSPTYTLREVWACTKCNWWEMQHLHADDWIYDRHLRHAVLQLFQPSDISLPVMSLRKHLRQQPDLIYRIHPTKMEELVQSVFQEYYQCEVLHCGKSHDQGVDLLLVNSDIQAIIQVKRRSAPKSVESVSVIRELLGATLLQEKQHSIFVTTADHFSPEAVLTVNRAVTLNIVKSFDLFDAKRFFEILGLLRLEKEEYWRTNI